MSSSTWIIISWVVVAILTIVNVLFFLKLKQASEQMMKMAFPNAKNMNDAMQQMQAQMAALSGGGARRGGGGNPFAGGRNGGGKNPQTEAQLKAAMDMLKNMQQGQPKGKR
jgi:hypothetical protein